MNFGFEHSPELPPIPDANGLAGMAAAIVCVEDGAPVILAAGGTNFPDKAPWDGGAKVVHRAIYRLDGEAWSLIGELPHPCAYAVCVSAGDGMLLAGGVDAEKHLDETLYVSPHGSVTRLAPLPTSVAYAAFAVVDNRLYVIGGQESPAATEALATTYRLDLARVDPDQPDAAQWETLPGPPFGGRILSIAGAFDGRVYLFGGCSLSADANGKAQRRYHADGAILLGAATVPAQLWSQTRPASLPFTLAAAATPACLLAGELFVIGGDTGAHYGQPSQEHPGQSDKILAYDPRADLWSTRGTWPLGIATAPALVWGHALMTVSGEIRPGVRSPAVAAMHIHPLDARGVP